MMAQELKQLNQNLTQTSGQQVLQLKYLSSSWLLGQINPALPLAGKDFDTKAWNEEWGHGGSRKYERKWGFGFALE